MSGACRGTTLAETLIALFLTTGLLLLIGSVLVHQQTAGQALMERLDGVESARVARDLVRLALTADPDARVGEGGLSIRAFVGVGERCGEEGFIYRGRRLPDPERDSLWVVVSSGAIRLADLTARRDGRCADGSVGRILDLEATPQLSGDVQLVRVFEAGRFRLDDAVRYGRWGGGAEPLSAPVLDRRRSGFAEGRSGISVVVAPIGPATEYSGTWAR
jgi:hypothetical protein